MLYLIHLEYAKLSCVCKRHLSEAFVTSVAKVSKAYLARYTSLFATILFFTAFILPFARHGQHRSTIPLQFLQQAEVEEPQEHSALFATTRYRAKKVPIQPNCYYDTAKYYFTIM